MKRKKVKRLTSKKTMGLILEPIFDLNFCKKGEPVKVTLSASGCNKDLADRLDYTSFDLKDDWTKGVTGVITDISTTEMEVVFEHDDKVNFHIDDFVRGALSLGFYKLIDEGDI